MSNDEVDRKKGQEVDHKTVDIPKLDLFLEEADPYLRTYIGPPIFDEEDHRIIAYPGRYYVQCELGRGGMGAVYQALDHALNGRKVVIKMLTIPGGLTLRQRNVWTQRFKREATALSMIHHDHVVSISDVSGPGERNPFIVMELLEGDDLETVLEVKGRYSQEECVAGFRVLAQIADALAAAHASGILHRDLKPANIFMVRGLEVRAVLVDFGIADVDETGDATRMTQSGVTVGTPGSMSPEQVRGELAGPATDWFALCAVGYEMFVGHGNKPYDTKPQATSHAVRLMAMAQAYQNGVEPWLDNLPKWLPAGFIELLRRGLDPDPAKRFESTEELRDLLCELAQISRNKVGVITAVSTGNTAVTVSNRPPVLKPRPSSPETLAAQTSETIRHSMPGRLDRRLVGAGLLLGVVMASVVGLVLSRPPQHVAAGLPRTAEPSRLVDLPVDAGALIEEPDVGVLPSEDSGVPEDAGPSTVEDASRSVSSRNARRLSPRQQAERAAERRDNAAIDASRRLMNQMCCNQRVDHILTRNGSRIACRPAPRDWMADHCGGRR